MTFEIQNLNVRLSEYMHNLLPGWNKVVPITDNEFSRFRESFSFFVKTKEEVELVEDVSWFDKGIKKSYDVMLRKVTILRHSIDIHMKITEISHIFDTCDAIIQSLMLSDIRIKLKIELKVYYVILLKIVEFITSENKKSNHGNTEHHTDFVTVLFNKIHKSVLLFSQQRFEIIS